MDQENCLSIIERVLDKYASQLKSNVRDNLKPTYIGIIPIISGEEVSNGSLGWINVREVRAIIGPLLINKNISKEHKKRISSFLATLYRDINSQTARNDIIKNISGICKGVHSIYLKRDKEGKVWVPAINYYDIAQVDSMPLEVKSELTTLLIKNCVENGFTSNASSVEDAIVNYRDQIKLINPTQLEQVTYEIIGETGFNNFRTLTDVGLGSYYDSGYFKIRASEFVKSKMDFLENRFLPTFLKLKPTEAARLFLLMYGSDDSGITWAAGTATGVLALELSKETCSQFPEIRPILKEAIPQLKGYYLEEIQRVLDIRPPY